MGGVVLIDPDSGAVLRMKARQHNPDSRTRPAIHAHCEGIVRDA
jgi:hypothetical protein